MSCFKGFLCYNGVEVFNAAQSFAYINGSGHPGVRGPIDLSCLCDGLQNTDDEGAPIDWTNPASDGAWWYDAAVPASADVVGLWVEDMKVSAPIGRDVKDKIWGATLGAATYGKREIVITGWVLTKSSEATNYMRRVLHEVFVGDSCSSCIPPDLTYWESCPVDDESTAHIRSVRQCGLSAPIDWATQPDFPTGWGAKFVITISSEVPWIAQAEQVVYEGAVSVGEPICNLCNPCPVVGVEDYACGCLTQPIRVAAEADTFGCYSTPLTVARSCFLIDPSTTWGNAVVNFSVYAGDAHNTDDSGLRNLRIRGWANPAGVGVDAASIVCDDPCIDIEISCLPAAATFDIDSIARRSTITRNGASSRGSRFLSSGGGQHFTWPSYDCSGLYLCIDADGGGTSPAATIRIATQEYERG